MEGNYKIKIGKLGEQLATQFLIGKGCKIIDKNFYTRFGEIDLIAQIGDEILFCEVKTRTSNDFGYPEQAVDERKRKKFLKSVDIYISSKNISQFWRMDIISVELNTKTKKASIRWFKNVTLK